MESRKHQTYADYCVWSREWGDELIDGVAYIREPPSPTQSHQAVVGEIHRQIANTLQGKPCRVLIAPSDVLLPKSNERDDDVDTVVQPDVFIVCDPRKMGGRTTRGAPDWLVEVLSSSTAKHDQVTKLAAYERAAVPEVWFVNHAARTVTIRRLEDGRYAPAVTFDLKGQTPIGSVPGVTIDWDKLLANTE